MRCCRDILTPLPLLEHWHQPLHWTYYSAMQPPFNVQQCPAVSSCALHYPTNLSLKVESAI